MEMKQELVAPKITAYPSPVLWNFDDVKNALTESVEKYRGLIVTDENVEDMERAAREITKYRTTIDRFKRAGKSELKKPVDRFAAQCDELLGIVWEVETPIRRQLDVYEMARVNAARDRAEAAFKAECEALGVRAENASFICDRAFLNRTQKWKDTEEAVKKQAQGCLAVQKEKDGRKELEALRREMLDMYAEKISYEMGLATPITVERCSLPLAEMPIDEAKAALEELAKRQAAVESAAREKAQTPSEPRAQTLGENKATDEQWDKDRDEEQEYPFIMRFDFLIKSFGQGVALQQALDKLTAAGVEYQPW